MGLSRIIDSPSHSFSVDDTAIVVVDDAIHLAPVDNDDDADDDNDTPAEIDKESRKREREREVRLQVIADVGSLCSRNICPVTMKSIFFSTHKNLFLFYNTNRVVAKSLGLMY